MIYHHRILHSCSIMFPQIKYSTTSMNHPHSVCDLLAAPSFSIPSQPVNFPAISSIFPIPCVWGSREAEASFIVWIPCSLSIEADLFHASEPVTEPTTPYKIEKTQLVVELNVMRVCIWTRLQDWEEILESDYFCYSFNVLSVTSHKWWLSAGVLAWNWHCS